MLDHQRPDSLQSNVGGLLNDKDEQVVRSLLATAIDHTRLTFSPAENEAACIEKLCQEAKHFRFFGVCVRPRHIVQAKNLLNQSDVKIATVIGFPVEKLLLQNELMTPTLGNLTFEDKLREARQAIREGADELDWVVNIANLKSDVLNGSQKVKDELLAIREASEERPVKAIIEVDLLSPEEIVAVTRWCSEAGIAMVKTSTGMIDGGHGATLPVVELIRDTLQSLNASTGIKASGGIKTREQALAFLNCGVSRLGTSAGVALIQGEAAASGVSY